MAKPTTSTAETQRTRRETLGFLRSFEVQETTLTYDVFTAAMAMGLLQGKALDAPGEYAYWLASYVSRHEVAMLEAPNEL